MIRKLLIYTYYYIYK